MSLALKKHIRKFISITEADYSEIIVLFEQLTVKKKEQILKAGDVCRSNYFVESGLLRMFFVNDAGVEQTVQFALENWWLSDYTSLMNGTPAEFSIQPVEKSSILAINNSCMEQLLTSYPSLERYFRLVHQRAHAASQFRIKTLYDLSKEEAYHQFSSRHPEFVQRIPQYLLASFLGFTPEYLSEIRARMKS